MGKETSYIFRKSDPRVQASGCSGIMSEDGLLDKVSFFKASPKKCVKTSMGKQRQNSLVIVEKKLLYF